MQSQDTEPGTRKREEHLSKDGQWRSFPKVPHLLQDVSNGNYYGRIKIKGKVIRESLETQVWSTAKLRLADFLKERLQNRNRVEPPRFSEAVEQFKRELENDTSIKPQSKRYRLWCLGKLQKATQNGMKVRIRRNQVPVTLCLQGDCDFGEIPVGIM